MPLNKALLGKRYPASTTEVTLDALQKYARAYNDDNPHYFDPAAPGGIVAPPMFAVVVTWIPVIAAITDPELHADLLRLLHSAQEMEFLAPIRPGDVITADARIASIEKSSGGETMTLWLEASNQKGTPVNHTAFTVFIRGRREPGGSGADSPRSSGGEADRGELLMSVAQTIDPDQTFRYAEASGDRNPIHIDDNVAKMAGLSGIVVHGLCTMAFTSKVMIDHLCGGDPIRLKRLEAHFSRPVRPGETITTHIWRTGERNGYAAYGYETRNVQGAAVIRGGIAEVSA
jgi:acyl dehydratase